MSNEISGTGGSLGTSIAGIVRLAD